MLRSEGHTFAGRYPIGKVWTEVELARERIDAHDAKVAVLLKMAVSSVLSEKDGKTFQKTVKELMGTNTDGSS